MVNMVGDVLRNPRTVGGMIAIALGSPLVAACGGKNTVRTVTEREVITQTVTVDTAGRPVPTPDMSHVPGTLENGVNTVVLSSCEVEDEYCVERTLTRQCDGPNLRIMIQTTSYTRNELASEAQSVNSSDPVDVYDPHVDTDLAVEPNIAACVNDSYLTAGDFPLYHS